MPYKVTPGVHVGVGVGVPAVAVAVGVGVSVAVAVGVNVAVAVAVGVKVAVAVAAAVGVGVGVTCPLNSSAPTSGATGSRALPSISSVTPVPGAAPCASGVIVPGGMCRSVSLTTGGGAATANEALSFVPAADRVLVYVRRFNGFPVDEGSKLAAKNSPVPPVVPTWASKLSAPVVAGPW